MRRLHRKRGFTLIELLAVIVIIGILGAIILPAVQNARRRSHGIKAYSEVKQLKNAWRSYVSTYMNDGRVTGLPSDTYMTPHMAEILLGLAAASTENPDMIRFMDLPVNTVSNGFADPWGTPYQVSFDPLEETTKTWMYATRVYCPNRDVAK
jgi:prepilin-type N-terminal cleavage/methylation domain-containing protein